MGSPKHLLVYPTNEPLFLDLFSRIRESCGYIPCFISLRDEEQARAVEGHGRDMDIEVIIDDPAQAHIGPAAGLLAAHRRDPAVHWLVVACDYPLLPARAIKMLCSNFEEPVTCFMNDEGWCEPLLGIWSPTALQELETNVDAGRTGPISTVKALCGRLLEPLEAWWLLNANTPQQWHDAVHQRRSMDAGTFS